MKVYLISCDLNVSEHRYRSLNAAIRKLGSGCHCLHSGWIIKSDRTSAQLASMLKSFFSFGDKLLVIEVSQDASWLGFDLESGSWLQTSL